MEYILLIASPCKRKVCSDATLLLQFVYNIRLLFSTAPSFLLPVGSHINSKHVLQCCKFLSQQSYTQREKEEDHSVTRHLYDVKLLAQRNYIAQQTFTVDNVSCVHV